LDKYINETILIKACINGDITAQKSLYQQFAPKMYGVCLRYCKRKEDAEDMLQEAMFKVFSNLQQYSSQGSFEGWMRKVVVRVILMELRKSKIDFSSLELDHYSLAEGSSFTAFDVFYREDLISALNTLPDGYRIIFNLYAIEGYSHQEIADQLGITTSTTKSQLSRARAVLKKIYDRKELLNNKI
jgi:RNA polymerase sigma factor (sigma-70 family)